MEMIETFNRDDYDTPRNRPGCTKMVKGDFLPGIPKQVNRGRYEYSSPRHLTLSKRRYPMPDASAGEFFVFGIRVYRLENSSASFVFGTSPGIRTRAGGRLSCGIWYRRKRKPIAAARFSSVASRRGNSDCRLREKRCRARNCRW